MRTALATASSFLLAAPFVVAAPASAGGQALGTGNFIHVTDVHIDPKYQAGTDPAEFCHRINTQDASKNVAGTYGTLSTKCDAPVNLAEASFDFMKTKLAGNADFVIMTGDFARHDYDKTDRRTGTDVEDDHKRVVDLFIKSFDVTKTPVIPTVGNNDEARHDYVPGGPSPVLETLAKLWAPLGLGLETNQDFLKLGSFYVDPPSANGNLRVLSVNSMYFFTDNTAFKDDCTPGTPGSDLLIWIESQLVDSRKAGRAVYIMGHVPPISDGGYVLYRPRCLSEYARLSGQYADVVLGHFHGHTNQDTLSFVVKHEKAGQATSYEILPLLPKKQASTAAILQASGIVGVIANGPSIVPTNNPAVRSFRYVNTVGGAKPFGTLADYTQYYVDLAQANKVRKVQFDVEYVAQVSFGLSDLSASSWAGVINRMAAAGSKEFERYAHFAFVQGPMSGGGGGGGGSDDDRTSAGSRFSGMGAAIAAGLVASLLMLQ